MRTITTLLLLTALVLGGCASGASTEVDPAKTRVVSKSEEKRPTETTTTKWSVTTAPQATPTYRLVITKKEPSCAPSSQPSPSSSPSSPPQQPGDSPR